MGCVRARYRVEGGQLHTLAGPTAQAWEQSAGFGTDTVVPSSSDPFVVLPSGWMVWGSSTDATVHFKHVETNEVATATVAVHSEYVVATAVHRPPPAPVLTLPLQPDCGVVPSHCVRCRWGKSLWAVVHRHHRHARSVLLCHHCWQHRHRRHVQLRGSHQRDVSVCLCPPVWRGCVA